ARFELDGCNDHLVFFHTGKWLPKKLLDDFVGALQIFLQLLRADEVLLVARPLGHDAGELRRDLDSRMGREILGFGHDLLALATEDEIREQHGGVRMLGALEHGERARRAWYWFHELRIYRRALAGTDQRVVGIDVDGDRVFAGDDTVDQRTGAA